MYSFIFIAAPFYALSTENDNFCKFYVNMNISALFNRIQFCDTIFRDKNSRTITFGTERILHFLLTPEGRYMHTQIAKLFEKKFSRSYRLVYLHKISLGIAERSIFLVIYSEVKWNFTPARWLK